ncbi:MAG: hypothetical protein U5L00_20505 [Desulfovermiculus sp.]|nr:hypothetical protein [Desulfovermiculus sp.]
MQMSLEWIDPFLPLIWGMATVSVFFFLASLVLIPWLIIRLPADYFSSQTRIPLRTDSPRPKLDFLLTVLKNLFGGLFILAGLVMLVLPGQGLLTILIGITMTNFPGKYRLEQGLARRKSILRAMNWFRRKARKAPLMPPPDKDSI